jgi:hypothetical protein
MHRRTSKNGGRGNDSRVLLRTRPKILRKPPNIPLELPTHNFFEPQTTAAMELDPTEDTNNQSDGEQQQLPNIWRGRLPHHTYICN